MRRLLGFAMLVLLSAEALAGSIIVTWELPTLYEDGTPIAAGELTATRLQLGTCTSLVPPVFGVASRADKIIANPGLTHTYMAVANGQYCVRGFAQAGTEESDPSNVIAVKVANKPKPIRI